MSPVAQRTQTSTSRVRRPFELGRWIVSPDAQAAKLPGEFILECFRRHTNCDFGALSAEAFDASYDAIADGSRIVSVYQHEGVRVCLITEADRTRTTLFLAEEY